MIRWSGWYIPLLIVATWCAVAYYSYYGVDGVRVAFYILLGISLVFGSISLIRSGRSNAKAGQEPTLFLVVTLCEKLVLLALTGGLVLSFINSFIEVDIIPVWFVQAEVGGAALALAITNAVLYFGRNHVGDQVHPGPLRIFFGKRRTR